MLSLTPGANIITVTATDAAGNTGTDTITVTHHVAPGEVSAGQDIAARGDTITISGSNLSTGGNVYIGSTLVSTDSWSDSAVTLTIPADAPGGPQTISVNSPYGSSVFDLFIGVDYPSGTLDDLANLNLPAGTAVRLGSGTFTQISPPATLTDLSLYGQGKDETTVASSGPVQLLTFAVNVNQHITLADLTIHSDFTVMGPDAPTALTTTAVEAGSSDLPPDTDRLLAQLIEQLESEPDLRPLSSDAGSITVRSVRFEEIAGGVSLVTARLDTGSPLPHQGSLHLEDVEAANANSTMMLMAAGNITIEDSTISGRQPGVFSAAGRIDISNSSFTDTGGSGSRGGFGILFHAGLQITDSEFESQAEDYTIAPIALIYGGAPVTAAAPIEIRDSTFQITDPDPASGTPAGTLVLGGAAGVSRIQGNIIRADRELKIATMGGNLLVEGNQLSVGHAGVSSAPLELHTSRVPSFIEFRNNEIGWLTDGGLLLDGNYGFLIEGNSLTGISGTALSVVQDYETASLDVTAVDNTFTDFTAALDITLQGPRGPDTKLRFNRNHFGFPVDAPGKVARLDDVVNTTIDAAAGTASGRCCHGHQERCRRTPGRTSSGCGSSGASCGSRAHHPCNAGPAAVHDCL